MIKGIIPQNIIKETQKNLGIENLTDASIRQLLTLSSIIEKKTGIEFIRMEMGIPGLPSPQEGIDAEIKALKAGMVSQYPPIDGIPPLKEELSRFAKLFLDIETPPECCIPTVGSIQGSFISFTITSKLKEGKNTILFLDPGFPVIKQQLSLIEANYISIDIGEYSIEGLINRIEEILCIGNVCSIIYSNPNNPTWMCFGDSTLAKIGKLCDKYDCVAIEDLAYFGMDDRQDYSIGGAAPYQPTIAKHTKNYIILFSGSKLLNYAGQRIGAILISLDLFNSHHPFLKHKFNTTSFKDTLTLNILQSISSGTSTSAQYGLHAMLKSMNENNINPIEKARIYSNRAKLLKKIFISNGFKIAYEKDGIDHIGDGFYFTLYHPSLNGDTLMFYLYSYGISALSLKATGSKKTNSIRACTSQVKEKQIAIISERVAKLGDEINQHHKKIRPK